MTKSFWKSPELRKEQETAIVSAEERRTAVALELEHGRKQGMTCFQSWTGKTIPIPERVVCFVSEYESLCRKYNLMVFSEGEEVWVTQANGVLWDIRKSIASRIEEEGFERFND